MTGFTFFLRRGKASACLQIFKYCFIGFTGSLMSCSPVLYTPVGQNVPLFHHKGEVALSGGYGGTDNTDGITLQTAAAVDSSTLVMASFYSFTSSSGGLSLLAPSITGSGTYFEIGAGKFKHNTKNKIITELTGGIGFGAIKNSYNNEYINANYIKPFIQPTIGVSTKYFEAAFTPKLAWASYTSKSDNVSDQSYKAVLDKYYSDKGSTFVFEPGLTLRAGLKKVKFQFQYTYTTFSYPDVSVNYNSTFTDFTPIDHHFISFGVAVLISKKR